MSTLYPRALKRSRYATNSPAGNSNFTSAYPDPSSELADGSENDFDIDLMGLVCRHLNLQLSRQRYLANNFDGIFDELRRKTCDAVISGTTITPDRAKTVRFSRPYAEFNQGVAVNRRLTPNASARRNGAGSQRAFSRAIPRISWPAAGLLKV